MDNFDTTLTEDERQAATFLEWSDATLARCVRAFAAKLHDGEGFNGITGMAAVLALEKIARDSNATKFDIELDGRSCVSVRLLKQAQGEGEG